MNNIALPSSVLRALHMLNAAGYEAFVVGGCVRDTLLGDKPTDWDITTSALPEETASVFSEYRIIETGLQHGTLTVILDSIPLEITTYRIDGAYTDNRRPDTVTFTRSLREDLMRRDFTVNALAYHPDTGIIDHFSGLADLANRRICCVGDPAHRFSEDALRIARALRFSSTLGFAIEKVTADTIHQLAPLLRRMAPERLAIELKKLLCGKNARQVLLHYPDVMCILVPELAPTVNLLQNNPYHYLTVYEHTVEATAAAPATPLLRLTMLFHDCGKPACYTRDEHGIDHFRGHPAISAAIAERAMENLRLDRSTITAVKQLILHHDDTLTLTDRCLLRLLNRLGPALAEMLVEVQIADVMGQHPDKRDRICHLKAVSHRLHELISEQACFSIKDLRINGDDLLLLGIPAGRQIGDLLHTLLEAVMDGACPNDRCALLAMAQSLKTD